MPIVFNSELIEPILCSIDENDEEHCKYASISNESQSLIQELLSSSQINAKPQSTVFPE